MTRVQFKHDGRRLLLLSAARDKTARVVTIPIGATEKLASILALLEADAGIQVSLEGGSGASASVTVPRPLTAETLRERRSSSLR